MNEELLNALKLIKEECKKQDSCGVNCPMWSIGNDECGVTGDAPNEWKLEKREVYF